jgi:hypothetical protein
MGGVFPMVIETFLGGCFFIVFKKMGKIELPIMPIVKQLLHEM